MQAEQAYRLKVTSVDVQEVRHLKNPDVELRQSQELQESSGHKPALSFASEDAYCFDDDDDDSGGLSMQPLFNTLLSFTLQHSMPISKL